MTIEVNPLAAKCGDWWPNPQEMEEKFMEERCECGFEMGHQGAHRTELEVKEQEAGQNLTEEGGGD